MKKILIIDDEVVRRDLISRLLTIDSLDYHIDLSPTFESAYSSILDNEYDVIFLDHDLGSSNVMADGYELAKLIKKSKNINATVIVISLNPAGISNICSVIPQAIVCPVYLLEKQWKGIKEKYVNV